GARLWQRARLRRRRGRVAHGGWRAFLQRRGVRRRIQLSADLARARLALPLAADADFGRGGGAGARADWAEAGVGARSHSKLSLGFQAEHELSIHAPGGIPIEADVRGGRVRVAPSALPRVLTEQTPPAPPQEQRVDGGGHGTPAQPPVP